MTVMENQVLMRSGLPAVIDWRRETRDLERFLAQMPFDVPLDASRRRPDNYGMHPGAEIASPSRYGAEPPGCR
jgi:hypothetical protein